MIRHRHGSDPATGWRGSRWMIPAIAAICIAGPASAQDTDTATYSVTFTGNWTDASTTPTGDLPGSAHFTTLIGAIHNSSVSFWSVGGTASRGVESMAEIGGTSTLRSEIEASPHHHAVIQRGVSFGGTGTATFNITVPEDHPLITLSSMIGPSPDWFVGITGRSLLDGQGNWRARVDINLYPYDAGTEDGETFSLNNPDTNPQGTITSLRGVAPFTNAHMATLSFVLDTTDQPPGRVTGVSVTPGIGTLAVSWNAVADADGYKVQWRSGGQAFGTARQRTVGSSVRAVTLSNLTPGVEHFVRVIATKTGTADGTPSNVQNGIPLAPPVQPPGRVSGVAVTPGIRQLTVSWNPVGDADGYKVQWRAGGQSFGSARQRVVGSSVTRDTIPNLTPGVQYFVRVIATKTGSRDGTPSNAANGTPTAPVNQPPESVSQIAMQFLEVGGSVRIGLSNHFRDPEGRTLTFSAVSDTTANVRVSVQGSVLTVRGVARGGASVTVTARDSGGLTASQSFRAMVGRVAFFTTNSASAPEGGTARLTVRLSRAARTSTSLEYAFSTDSNPNTSDANAADYQGTGGTLTIPAGRTDTVIEIAIADDTDIEPAREVFTVTLTVPAEHENDIALGTATATVIIEEGVCDRTPEVRDALRGLATCSAVSTFHLNRQESLVLADMEVDALQSRDFDYLPRLRDLDIHGNRLQTLPAGLLSGLGNLVSLRLDGNSLTELNASALTGLDRLQQLRLDGNRLAALPDGLFLGIPSLTELQLQDNPGAPFTLTLALARTDADNMAPGPATVVATVPEGAPFEMRQRVSASNGDLSTDYVVVPAGNTASVPITVTKTGEGAVRVALDAAPPIPTTLCGDDSHPCFRGIATAAGPTLVLFKNPLRATDSPPALDLLATGDPTTVELAPLFTGAEGETLTYAVESSNPELLSVRVEGGNLVLLPNDVGEGGLVTVSVTATDEDGLTATVSFVVAIEPNPRGFLRGWRKGLFEE